MARVLLSSKLSGFAALELRESFGGERIKLTGGDVALELAIPELPIVLRKPGPKCCKLLGREALYVALNRFESCHDDPLPLRQRERPVQVLRGAGHERPLVLLRREVIDAPLQL